MYVADFLGHVTTRPDLVCLGGADGGLGEEDGGVVAVGSDGTQG